MKTTILIIFFIIIIIQIFIGIIGLFHLEKEPTNNNCRIKNFFILFVLFIKSIFCLHSFYRCHGTVAGEKYTRRSEVHYCKKCIGAKVGF